MSVPVPKIQVPVTVFLELVRLYKELPQEVINRQTYLDATWLEKVAYRKFRGWMAASRKEKQS